jgi:glycosyltransferase involved in cell wall biosynthesis
MKLLIITQKVNKNDPILGFFCEWVEQFAKHFAFVNVICLEKGQYDRPTNVSIISLGKESGLGRLTYFKNFFKYLLLFRSDYDAVFVHMNPIYIVLAGWWWKLSGKKIFLWYTHRQVDWKLKIAEKFADIIFTSTKESFNIKSQKVVVVGHGINVEKFKKPENYKKSEKFTIISIGRISPIKNLETLLLAADILRSEKFDFQVMIVGSPIREDDLVYFKMLQKIVSDKKLESIVRFVGSVPGDKVAEYYWQSDLSINLCPTGGMDKAVLESMAAGLPVLISNQAFADYLGYDNKNKLFFDWKKPESLAGKILDLYKSGEMHRISDELQKNILLFSLDRLIDKVSFEITTNTKNKL